MFNLSLAFRIYFFKTLSKTGAYNSKNLTYKGKSSSIKLSYSPRFTFYNFLKSWFVRLFPNKFMY